MGSYVQWVIQELSLIHEPLSSCLLPLDLLLALPCSGGHETS